MSAFSRIITVEIKTKTKVFTIPNDFKMDFVINKTESADPNTCTLNIYNLQENTRNQFNNEGSLITVKAGYLEGAGAEVIFIGDITDVSHSRVRPYVITNIEAKDGYETLKSKKISMSYKEGVKIRTLIDRAVDALGLPLKTKSALAAIKTKIYKGGFQFTGTVKKLLDDLTGDGSEIWSIQNNELKLYNANGSDKSFSLIINKDSGMIGSPKQIKIKRGKGQKSVNGWEIQSELQPKAEPGGNIKLKSLDVPNETDFKIINVVHSSDNTKGKSITTLQVL